MIRFLPEKLKSFIVTTLLVLNLLVLAIVIMPIALLKLIFNFKLALKILNPIITFVLFIYNEVNNICYSLPGKIDWQIKGTELLKKDESYLIILNHQTWVDIPVISRAIVGQVPIPKFFLKKELMWVPILNVAWWALDYPYMKRYTKEEKLKNPSLKGKDVEITRKACEKFKGKPVSVINFVEGTRKTESKYKKQNPEYKNLLKPRASGISFAINTLRDDLKYVLDLTIYYPDGAPDMSDLVSGRIKTVVVEINKTPIDKKLIGDYENDEKYRKEFQDWINEAWHKKDKDFDRIVHEFKKV